MSLAQKRRLVKVENNLTKYKQAILKIIREQTLIVGPLARNLVEGLDDLVFNDDVDVEIKTDPKKALEEVVEQYGKVFGKTSIEVCKRVVRNMPSGFTESELPDVLK